MQDNPISEAFTMSGYTPSTVPVVPTALVALSAGCMALFIGTFIGAALTPSHALERGFAYALVPSVLAGAGMAYAYERHPAFAARTLKATTGVILPTR